jgi:hypothetical protein
MPRELLNQEKECIRDLLDDNEILRVFGDSFKVANILYKKEAEVISSRDLANILMKEGANSAFFKYSGFSKEMVLYHNNYNPLIFISSPFLVFYKGELEQSEYSHEHNYKNKSEPQISQSEKNHIIEYLRSSKTFKIFYESALQDKNKEPDWKYSLILKEDMLTKIPTNRLSEEDLGLFHYRDLAYDFGNFLNENKIKFVDFSINPIKPNLFNQHTSSEKSYYRHCFHCAGESQDIDYTSNRFENFYFGIRKK